MASRHPLTCQPKGMLMPSCMLMGLHSAMILCATAYPACNLPDSSYRAQTLHGEAHMQMRDAHAADARQCACNNMFAATTMQVCRTDCIGPVGRLQTNAQCNQGEPHKAGRQQHEYLLRAGRSGEQSTVGQHVQACRGLGLAHCISFVLALSDNIEIQ